MTFLQHLGSFFKKVLQIGTAVAVAAEPAVAIFLPGIKDLFNSTVDHIVTAEGTAAAIGQQNGSGAQKAAAVIQALEPTLMDWGVKNGVTITPEQKQKWLDGSVALLNIFSAPTVQAVIPTIAAK